LEKSDFCLVCCWFITSGNGTKHFTCTCKTTICFT